MNLIRQLLCKHDYEKICTVTAADYSLTIALIGCHKCGRVKQKNVRWTEMPMDKPRYPPDWTSIATAIKDAAGWTCQQCGKQCRIPGEPLDTHRNTLTVAHLDHTPENCAPENLRALCAPCHLRYDATHHADTRKATMARQRANAERA